MSKVLIVATSRKTKGGISSVIEAHEKGEHWKEFKCHWVQTHRDGSVLRKLSYLMWGLMDFVVRLPFYDIVHIHVSQPMTIRRKSIFLRLAKSFNKKIITHFHAFNTEETIDGNARNLYKQFFEKSDMVIVLSNWWKKQLMNSLNMSPEQISVLYNPCPTVSKKETSKENIILYAGAVNERKGYKDLIKAFASIHTSFSNWKIVFAGNGEIEEGISLAKQFGIESQVEFTGWVTGEAKADLFRKAKIFCLPSYAEGFPMAVLEAWAYGLPVITTPVGGIPDVAIDSENMLLFNPGDIKKLSQNIKKLISNQTIYEKISHASLDFSKNKFNNQTINRQLKELYLSLNKKG